MVHVPGLVQEGGGDMCGLCPVQLIREEGICVAGAPGGEWIGGACALIQLKRGGGDPRWQEPRSKS